MQDTDATTLLVERMELIAQDTKKVFSYARHSGTWSWANKDEADDLESWHDGFGTRYDALVDAVEPYMEDEEL